MKTAWKHLHVEKEIRRVGDPFFSVRAEVATWGQAMHMRLVGEFLVPDTQDYQKANLSGEVMRIGSGWSVCTAE